VRGSLDPQVAGEWEIKPRWRHDYEKMIREQLPLLGRTWPNPTNSAKFFAILAHFSAHLRYQQSIQKAKIILEVAGVQ
jgi:hypothetical protein